DPARFSEMPHAIFAIGHVGAAMKRLRSEGIAQVVFAGGLQRPALHALKVDLTGAKLLAKLTTARSKGDDILLRIVTQFFENEGFEVLGAEEILAHLLTPIGTLGAHAPDAAALEDIALGTRIAREIGRLDIGQAAVIQAGYVLAVEAAEGT